MTFSACISSRRLMAGLACALLLFQTPAFAQPSGAAALAAYQGADRERLLMAGAKREGELTLYSSMQVDSIIPLQKAFEAKYGLKIRILSPYFASNAFCSGMMLSTCMDEYSVSSPSRLAP